MREVGNGGYNQPHIVKKPKAKGIRTKRQLREQRLRVQNEQSAIGRVRTNKEGNIVHE